MNEYNNNEMGPTYSNKVLILAFDREKEELLTYLCAKYNLEIIYDYKNFNMAALAIKEDLTEEEIEDLLQQLRLEDGVISVEKDQIIQIDENN